MSKGDKKLGAAGEQVACDFLQRAGYRILERNFTCTAGELDIVCADAATIVFVEVKSRVSDQAADPLENVTAHKRGQLIKAAQFWLARHRYPERAYRFDAVSVVLPRDGEPRVRHVVEAFVPGR